jgi:hypothetical protein
VGGRQRTTRTETCVWNACLHCRLARLGAEEWIPCGRQTGYSSCSGIPC